MHESRAPALRATYRVQLHAEFTLRDAEGIVAYLDELGVSHLYTSPILAARTGSRHGYDVVDPRRINPELGTEDDLRALAGALHSRGMGLLVDIVPNHMGAISENPYWEDVLSYGERSRYAKWFDIAWRMHDDGRLVLPILRDDLDAVIERGELRVDVGKSGARLVHFDVSVPISPDTLPEGPNGEVRLRALLDAQHYRLVGWRHGGGEINYRRFFDINDLVGLRAEDSEVFAETHELILRLVGDGVIDALRVDHVDGLRDPLAYLRRLRAETAGVRAGGVPIVVEKILMEGERLRDAWPVDGTTGYERLNEIDDLFIDPDGFARIEDRYRTLRRLPDLSFAATVRADKRAVLDRSFPAEVKRLARLLDSIFQSRGGPQTREQIYHGIEEFIANFPVYRSYLDASGVVDDDDARALRAAAWKSEGRSETVSDVICAIIAGEDQSGEIAVRREFIDRMQQLTGPAMAKGLEDTAHYAYVPLASRNEVGGAPDRRLTGVVDVFHATNADYSAHRPRSFVATATHDTKRSGDVRARIGALSELADEWQRSVGRWRKLNRRHRSIVGGRIVPDPNAELLLYQTLVGVWPAPRAGRRADDIPDKPWRSSALERLTQYMVKAVREAKLRTSWTDPNDMYEAGLTKFVASLLSPPEDDPFLGDVSRLVSLVTPIAQWNSIARVLLHLTIPGTPDIYQGDELWNFALVDPDNRRPVDYVARQSSLDSISSASSLRAVEDIFAHPSPKLLVTRRVLAARRRHERLFTSGGYLPLVGSGPRSANVVAFARSAGDEHAVVVAPRLIGELLHRPVGDRWVDTVIQLPTDIAEHTLRCAITGRPAVIRRGKLILAETSPQMAFGLFVTEEAQYAYPSPR